jgi:hypothetical protein
MDRRNFLKLAAIIGAGLYMPGTVNKLIGSLTSLLSQVRRLLKSQELLLMLLAASISLFQEAI